MHIRSIITGALLAVAAIFAAQPSAEAALSYTPGDLFVGFRADGGTGASQDYLVNIGQFSLYTSVAAGSTITVGNYGSDLTSVFGSSWNTSRGDGNTLYWGVVGTAFSNLGDSRSIYVSQQLSSSTAFVGIGPTSSLATISNIQGVANGYLNNNGTVSSTNPNTALTQNISDGSSWASFFEYPSNLDFNRFDEIEGNFILGTSSDDAKLNLFRIDAVNGSAAVLLGTFSISNSGIVTFTAVPEPSTVAYVGLTAVFAFIFLVYRRRAVSTSQS